MHGLARARADLDRILPSRAGTQECRRHASLDAKTPQRGVGCVYEPFPQEVEDAMPYADPEQQRRAQRESVARRRQQAREAAARNGSTPAPVEPDAPVRLPPSPGDLYRVGQWLNCPRMPHEPYPAYHARLRSHWRELLAILEGE
jgi:hypothetical protein